MASLRIAVCTYNRPKHLLNCIASLEQNCLVPFSLAIYDDASTDRDAQIVLDELNQKYEVYINKLEGQNKKVKGLYANMNLAVKHSIDGGFNYLLILQDDVQLVRELKLDYLSNAAIVFRRNNVFSITSFFYKKNHQLNYEAVLDFDEESQMYLPKNSTQKYLTGIADMGLYDVAKLLKTNWQFEDDEAGHIEKGRQMGLIRAATLNPYFAFLPWPSTHRVNTIWLKRVLVSALDAYYQVGFHPLKSIKSESEKRLQNRELFDFPFAEDYLETLRPTKLKEPWNYYDSLFPFKQSIKKILKNG